MLGHMCMRGPCAGPPTDLPAPGRLKGKEERGASAAQPGYHESLSDAPSKTESGEDDAVEPLGDAVSPLVQCCVFFGALSCILSDLLPA